ncbi:MAG: threonylcarbamoyl-AMP synthase [Labilithrix sp.]|nr:threonylcarbamoyl-AMP synthase [Labilithrix sp.]
MELGKVARDRGLGDPLVPRGPRALETALWSHAVPRVVPVDPAQPDPAAIADAAEVMRRGGLVAFPTETVYGLGARGLRAEEVRKIFAAKGRPPGHPVILHVDGEAMARSLAAEWSSSASRLAAALWPGPLTLVVPRAPAVPPEVSGGLDTVGIRAPAHPVALALIRAVGEPLAAPSANAHTHVSPTTAAHVVRSLGDRVELVLDAGPTSLGIESTVVSLGHDPPRVLRPGSVSLERLCAIDPRVVHERVSVEGDHARAAPGMAAKHYAPRTRVLLAARGGEAFAQAIARSGLERARIAAIVVTDGARVAAAGCALVVPLADSPEEYARGLFAALHEVDAAGVDLVVIEEVPAEPGWWAVADRLTRAARR